MVTLDDMLALLWANPVSITEVGIVSRRVVLQVGRADAGAREHEVRFEGVSRPILNRSGGEPRAYAEASEAGVIDGNTLDLVLWDEPNGLSITFAAAYLDDVRVTKVRR